MILNQYKNIFGAIPIESVVRENQENYYRALEEAGSIGESTPFVEFMLEIILKTLKKVKKDNVPKNVPRNVPLKRLDKIVNMMKKDKNITALELADKLGVTDKTIKRDISKLKDKKRVVRVGSLKSGYWEIVDEI